MAREYLVITVIGPDKPGVVARITAVVSSYSANIEESRMARLGGEFAVIMLLSIAGEKKDALVAGLDSIKEPDVVVFVRRTSLSRVKLLEGFVPYEISVIGADHEGIVYHVADYLASQRVHVESMDTNVTSAPLSGTPLFSMHAVVQSPPDLTLHQLRQKLNELGSELGVDIEVKLPAPGLL